MQKVEFKVNTLARFKDILFISPYYFLMPVIALISFAALCISLRELMQTQESSYIIASIGSLCFVILFVAITLSLFLPAKVIMNNKEIFVKNIIENKKMEWAKVKKVYFDPDLSLDFYFFEKTCTTSLVLDSGGNNESSIVLLPDFSYWTPEAIQYFEKTALPIFKQNGIDMVEDAKMQKVLNDPRRFGLDSTD